MWAISLIGALCSARFFVASHCLAFLVPRCPGLSHGARALVRGLPLLIVVLAQSQGNTAVHRSELAGALPGAVDYHAEATNGT